MPPPAETVFPKVPPPNTERFAVGKFATLVQVEPSYSSVAFEDAVVFGPPPKAKAADCGA